MSSEFDDVPVLAKEADAAKLLQVCPRTVWQMGKDGQIRREKIRGAVRYCVREFLQQRQRLVADGKH